MIDFSDLDELAYARVSAEHRTQRVAHWQQRFAAPIPPPERHSGPGALEIPEGNLTPAATSNCARYQPLPELCQPMRKCLNCPTMVDGRRIRCHVCAKLVKYEKSAESRRARRKGKCV